jgi:glyoxylase-like metal-dependent hydrolase (beta-lactamase superfamily II)
VSPWPDSCELSSLTTLDDRWLHVFVIGPGEGEAIAVALPRGCGWLLVDGCTSGAGESGLVEVFRRYRRGDEPILVYVLTHPHLDHARGIVSLCEKYGPDIRLPPPKRPSFR